MHLAPAGHIKAVGRVLHFSDPEGHVLQQLPEQPVPNLAGSDKFAVPSGEGAIVDGEGHLHGGGGDLDKFQRLHALGRTDGITDGDFTDAGHGDNVARLYLLNRHPLQAVVLVNGGGLKLFTYRVRVVVIADLDLLVLLDATPLNAADGNSAHKLIVVDGGDQHLEGGVQIHLRGGDVVQNGFKQGFQVSPRLIGVLRRHPGPGGTEQNGRIQLFVGGIQIHEQLQHLVNDLVNPLVGPVNLVDHHNHPMSQLQSPAEHEAGLGHGALRRIHQQDDSVDHLEDALYLTAKVGVARRVHNVDFGIFIGNGGVFGQDRNPPFPLQVAGVHHPLHYGLVVSVHAALLEHGVHQGGFAVVNVGNNGDISQF